MKLDYRTTETLEASLHQAAADQALAELGRVLAYHNSRQLLAEKRASLAEVAADLAAAEEAALRVASEFTAAGEVLFETRHHVAAKMPALTGDGGIAQADFAPTRNALHDQVAEAEKSLRDANAAKRAARDLVQARLAAVKQLNHEISLLEAIDPPTAAPGLSVVLSFLGACNNGETVASSD